MYKDYDWLALDWFLQMGWDVYPFDRDIICVFVERDGLRTVARTLCAFHSWSSVNNKAAVFTLAMCVAYGDLHTRRAAAAAVNQVCYTLGDLYEFNAHIETMRGRGRIVNRILRRWFNSRTTGELAHQMMMYPEQNGWRARDLLRLAHPRPPTAEHALIYQWACEGWAKGWIDDIPETVGTELILAHERNRKRQQQSRKEK